MEDKICKHCSAPIRLIPFILVERWMHVNPNAGFPSTNKGTLWEYCEITVAEPVDSRADYQIDRVFVATSLDPVAYRVHLRESEEYFQFETEEDMNKFFENGGKV